MNEPEAAGARDSGAGVSPRKSNDRSALTAAYREGLGLAAVAVICGPAGIRITAVGSAANDALAAAERVQARWWCRHTAQAECVAAAANARLRRRESRNSTTSASTAAILPPDDASPAWIIACESITRAAKQCQVVLQSDQELSDEVMGVIVRIDGEIEKLQRSGALKSVNKAYQTYRIETSGRGERVLRYQEWMGRYREDLVRRLASTLRYL